MLRAIFYFTKQVCIIRDNSEIIIVPYDLGPNCIKTAICEAYNAPKFDMAQLLKIKFKF